MRDYQVSKVYKAEQKISNRTFKDSDDAIRWLKKISMLEGKYISMEINPRSIGWSICETENKIVFPGKSDWWQDELVLLHELAHTNIHWAFAPHGIEFCQEYLRLVKKYSSDPSMYCRLKNAFKQTGVNYYRNEKFDRRLKRKIKSSPQFLVLNDGSHVFGTFETMDNLIIEKESNTPYDFKSIAYAGP